MSERFSCSDTNHRPSCNPTRGKWPWQRSEQLQLWRRHRESCKPFSPPHVVDHFHVAGIHSAQDRMDIQYDFTHEFVNQTRIVVNYRFKIGSHLPTHWQRMCESRYKSNSFQQYQSIPGITGTPGARHHISRWEFRYEWQSPHRKSNQKNQESDRSHHSLRIKEQ